MIRSTPLTSHRLQDANAPTKYWNYIPQQPRIDCRSAQDVRCIHQGFDDCYKRWRGRHLRCRRFECLTACQTSVSNLDTIILVPVPGIWCLAPESWCLAPEYWCLSGVNTLGRLSKALTLQYRLCAYPISRADLPFRRWEISKSLFVPSCLSCRLWDHVCPRQSRQVPCLHMRLLLQVPLRFPKRGWEHRLPRHVPLYPRTADETGSYVLLSWGNTSSPKWESGVKPYIISPKDFVPSPLWPTNVSKPELGNLFDIPNRLPISLVETIP